jgi:hypothetical protein
MTLIRAISLDIIEQQRLWSYTAAAFNIALKTI